MTTRVLIADDHKIVREGLMSILEKEPGIDVVAMADNGKTALQLAGELRPDVAVIDIAMPEMNGIEAIRRISGQNPEIRILALSMHSARRFVVEALSAGAKGYILKDCASDELVRAIRVVAGGETYLSPKITGIIVRDYVKRLPESQSLPSSLLSNREREVLQLIAEGQGTKEVAFALGVSVKTVETHRQQIMKKLNLHNVAELTRYAIREGITPLD
ncbi:MAG: response regulator transcription factor [Deltaproteobacteria bacterium]|nr:response regulator transcription factor [Deltaproteobacteria bacterium]